MTETSDRVRLLLENFSRLDGDGRWAILSELEAIAERHPEKVLPHIDQFLEQYRQLTGAIRQPAGRVLQKLLDHPPSVSLRVIQELNGIVSEIDDTTRDSVYEATFALMDEHEDDLWQSLSTSDIEPLLENDIESRKKAYRLLGLVGGPSSAKTLTERVDIETGEIADTVWSALETLTQQASTKLEKEDSTVNAAQTLSLIADSYPQLLVDRIDLLYQSVFSDKDAVSEATADALVSISKSNDITTDLEIWNLVDKLNTTHRTAHGRVVGAVAAENESEFEDVITEIVNQLEGVDSDSGQEKLLTALVEAANVAEMRSFPELNKILDLQTGLSTAHEPKYIELLGNIARSVDGEGRVIPVLVSALQNESVEVRRAAARGIVNTDIYPAPSALEASTNDPDQLVRELVDAASGQHPQDDILPVQFNSDSDSRLLGMDTELKYQTEPGRWDPVIVDEYHRTLLQNISLAYQSNGSNQIHLPYYEPQAGLLIVFELALQDSTRYSGPTVVLYSPGTQNHWGTFGDIQDGIGRFGLGDDNITGHALPFDHWLTLSRVQGDTTEPYNSSAYSGSEVVLIKNIDGIEAVNNPDAVVCNLQARTSKSGDEIVREIRSKTSQAPIFLKYSYFTKDQTQRGWPEYGYPAETASGTTPAISRFPVQALSEDISTPMLEDIATPTQDARHQLDRLGQSRPLTIHQFGNEEILDALGEIYSHYKDLDEPDTEELASTVRSRLYGVRRLPVPVDIYNQWVRQEAISHGRFAPDTTQQLIHSLKQRGESYDLAYVPATVRAVAEELETVYESLGSNNPKFTYLVEQIGEYAESEAEVAILFLSEHMRQVFKYGIKETTLYDPETLRDQGIYLCGPDQFRNHQPVERLILVSDVPAALASYYLTPGVERIDLLNYGKSIQSKLSEWVDQRAIQIHDRMAVPDDVDWPAVPALHEQEHGAQVDATPPEDETPVPGPSVSSLSLEGETNDLAGEFTSSDASTSPDTVEIKTASNKKVRLDFNQSLLKQQHHSGPTEYVWTSAGNLGEGDTFVVIPENVRRQLYEDTLQELYEEELADLEYMESLNLWWNTMRDIYQEYEDTDVIYSLLDRHGLEKSKAAVEDWFRAVRAAEKPLDLVEYPELTIGPDSATDILIIGETFDKEDLIEHAGFIQNVMERFRKENREKGRELNERILSMVEDPSSDISSRSATHEVRDIEYLS